MPSSTSICAIWIKFSKANACSTAKVWCEMDFRLCIITKFTRKALQSLYILGWSWFQNCFTKSLRIPTQCECTTLCKRPKRIIAKTPRRCWIQTSAKIWNTSTKLSMLIEPGVQRTGCQIVTKICSPLSLTEKLNGHCLYKNKSRSRSTDGWVFTSPK